MIGDSHALRTNIINAVAGDARDNIWVGTSRGLVVYDQAKGLFNSAYFSAPASNVRQRVKDNALEFMLIENNIMLVGMRHTGLIVFDKDFESGRQVPYSSEKKDLEYGVTAIILFLSD